MLFHLGCLPLWGLLGRKERKRGVYVCVLREMRNKKRKLNKEVNKKCEKKGEKNVFFLIPTGQFRRSFT